MVSKNPGHKVKPLTVVSLFDGMRCGAMALQRAGLPIGQYYASEVDRFAIKAAQYVYPQGIDLGDVTQLNYFDFPPEVDLLMGGSPCQGFSFAGKQLNFEDPRSKLFFEFVRLVKEIGPKYFLLENVKMKQAYQDVITEALGVEPIEINSNLVSAQNRVRLYWTNIPDVIQPEDRGVNLIDVLENTDMPHPAGIVGRKINSRGVRDDYNKSLKPVQCLEVKQPNRINKSNCLTTVSKDNVLTSLPSGRHPGVYTTPLPYRNYTRIEMGRLQTIDDPTTIGIITRLSKHQFIRAMGNGWTIDVIAHILGGIKP